MAEPEKFHHLPIPLESPEYDRYRSCWPTRDYIPRRFSVSIVVFLGAWIVMITRVFISVTLTGDNGMQDEYNWSDVDKGYILSSFYWGYILPQLFGGWLAVKYGGRHVFGLGTLFSIIFSTLTPLAASVYPLLLLCRVMCGFAEGFCIPSMFTFAARWIPPAERSRTLSFFAGASYFGTAFAFALTPALMELVGWRNVFYVYGALGGIWYILWILFGWSNPEEHPNCPRLETEYIRECLSVDRAIQQKLLSSPTPWRTLFTAVPIWAPIVGHFSFNWAYYTLVSFLPEYFDEVLGFDVSGSYNQVLPYILMFLMAQLSGRIVEILTRPNPKTNQGIMVLLNARRFVVALGFLIPAGVLCGIVYVNKTLAVAFFTISVGFTGLTASGYFSNFGDVAPFHSGVVVGVSNTLATIPGIVSPIVSGYILDAGSCITDTDDGTVQPDSCTTSWQIIFGISSVVFVFGWAIFSYFAKAVMIVDSDGKRTDLYLTPQQRLSAGDGIPYQLLDDSYLKSAQPRLSKDDGPFIQ